MLDTWDFMQENKTCARIRSMASVEVTYLTIAGGVSNYRICIYNRNYSYDYTFYLLAAVIFFFFFFFW